MNFDSANSEKKASAIKALWDSLIMQVHSWSVVSFVLNGYLLIRTRESQISDGLSAAEFLDQIKLLATQQTEVCFKSKNKLNGNVQDDSFVSDSTIRSGYSYQYF